MDLGALLQMLLTEDVTEMTDDEMLQRMGMPPQFLETIELQDAIFRSVMEKVGRFSVASRFVAWRVIDRRSREIKKTE